MEILLNKCQLIIVSIFGNALTAKINLNAKREIAVFIVLMAVLSALRYKKENAVNVNTFSLQYSSCLVVVYINEENICSKLYCHWWYSYGYWCFCLLYYSLYIVLYWCWRGVDWQLNNDERIPAPFSFSLVCAFWWLVIGRSSDEQSSVVARSVSRLFLNASTKRWLYWQVF